MAATEPHPALAHSCPFCGVDPGRPCRTHRGRGHELDHPHSRRITLARPDIQAIEAVAKVPVNALCCECGQLRTVSADYSRYRDPNHADSDQGKTGGWRLTQTLKCSACGDRTRHALLRRHDAPYRDADEQRQQWILGHDVDGWGSDRGWARAEYFAQFPRNPKLHHWFDTNQADEARQRGETHMAALCGATDTVPKSWSNRSKKDDPVAPDEVDWDTEFEDPETGMWWIDMDCVDCLKNANDRRQVRRRQLLEALLAWFARHPETISDYDAGQPCFLVVLRDYQ